MKPKTVVTAALLLFVAVSVAYLVVTEIGGTTERNATQIATTSPQAAPEPSVPPAVSSDSESTTATAKVVVYYFHGNVRCVTCRAIESNSKEAVETGFADALRDGRLEWRVVNVDDPGNEHFVQDFQLATSSVVLEQLADGKRQDWKNLQHVWKLVGGDKTVFLEYIQDETKTYLEAADK